MVWRVMHPGGHTPSARTADYTLSHGDSSGSTKFEFQYDIADRTLGVADRTLGVSDRTLGVADRTLRVADGNLAVADRTPGVADGTRSS
jgi:hypothetical protein